MGMVKIIVGSISPYANWISLALIGVTSFYTTINPIATGYGITLPFWLFCLIVVLIVIAMSVLEWMFMMPSFYKASNTQAWEAGGPIRDIQEACYREIGAANRRTENMEKELTEIKKTLKELVECKGRQQSGQ